MGLKQTVQRIKYQVKTGKSRGQKESLNNGGIRKIQCSKNRGTTVILIKMKRQFKNPKINILELFSGGLFPAVLFPRELFCLL